MCSTRGSFETVASQSQNPLIQLLNLDSSPISHTHPLQLKLTYIQGKMIEKIIIKFDTELKSTQYSWKSQLYTN